MGTNNMIRSVIGTSYYSLVKSSFRFSINLVIDKAEHFQAVLFFTSHFGNLLLGHPIGINVCTRVQELIAVSQTSCGIEYPSAFGGFDVGTEILKSLS